MQRSVVSRPTEISGHTDRGGVSSLFAPLAYGALAWAALGNHMLVAAAAVAFAAQGLSSIFWGFAIAGARGAGTDVHSIGVGGVLLERR